MVQNVSNMKITDSVMKIPNKVGGQEKAPKPIRICKPTLYIVYSETFGHPHTLKSYNFKTYHTLTKFINGMKTLVQIWVLETFSYDINVEGHHCHVRIK